MLQRKYQSQQNALQNYDYVDIASGVGVETFYGTKAVLSGSTAYSLIGDVAFAGSGSTTFGANTTTTINFDSPLFNTPRTVQGKGYISIIFDVNAGGWIFGTFTLQKWDGTTATDISGEYITPNLTINSEVYFIPLTCTQTQIKIGEQIRLKAVISTAAVAGRIFHDPMNALLPANTISTILKVGVPFRIDI